MPVSCVPFLFASACLSRHIVLRSGHVLLLLRLRLSYVRVMFQDTFQDLRRNRRALGGLSRRALGRVSAGSGEV
jgi:hypothetical protein